MKEKRTKTENWNVDVRKESVATKKWKTWKYISAENKQMTVLQQIRRRMFRVLFVFVLLLFHVGAIKCGH